MWMIPVTKKAIRYFAVLFFCLWRTSVVGQVIEEMHAFDWPHGSPSGGLVEASDGNFYGVTEIGGPGGEGTIFRVTPSGDLSIVVAFDGFNGARPHPELAEGDDGHLYGTGSTIFRIKLNGELTTISSYSVTNDLNPVAGLTKGRDGYFYGADYSRGSNRMGSVFRITADGLLTTLAEFNGTNGGYPECTLIEGEEGSLYGTTTRGGEHGLGTVFRVKPFESIEALMSFDGTNGYQPTSGLTKAADGSIYGMTSRGGRYDNGIIFRIDPTGECSPVASFGHEIDAPRGRLIQATDGNFYGAAESVFRFNMTNGIQALTTFFTGPNYPGGTLLQASDGYLYGADGGTNGRGGVFRMDLNGNWATLASFPAAPNGYQPFTGLARGQNDLLYGTTRRGGLHDSDTLFEFNPSNRSLTMISSGPGIHPQATLLVANDGVLFGTSSDGVFRVSSGIVSPFASFQGEDSRRPEGSLAQDNEGNLYGTTYWEGDHDLGTIFKISPLGEITTLHSFNGAEGAHPSAGLLWAGDGNLYGTTKRGGPTRAKGFGTVFKINPAGEYTSLAFFSGTNGGAFPEAELIKASDGNFYGTTSDGGTHSGGTIFKVTPSGDLAMVFSFGYKNGAWPKIPLLEMDGVLYGTTQSGGEFLRGVVFGVSLSGELKTLVSFNRRNGTSPRSGLTRGLDGHLYGTTPRGGSLGLSLIHI